MNDEPFNHRRYAIRVMQSKGYMLKKLPDGTFVDTDAEVMTVFNLQLPSWKLLLEKHHFAADESIAERMLTSFGHREVKGGPGKVLETFAAHLDAQPKQGGSPDWTRATQESHVCGWCDGRGVVSNIPVRVERRGEVVDRRYSFACKCDRGRFFAGMRIADDWMIQYAADRKNRYAYGHKEKLKRFGIDPDASPQKRAEQFHAFITTIKEQDAAEKRGARREAKSPSGVMQAANAAIAKVKIREEFDPEEVNQIRQKIASIAARKPQPPEKLNPERVALAVYANGDERNEWE